MNQSVNSFTTIARFVDRGEIAARKNGSLVSMESGEATNYALNMVQERGRLMVEAGET